MYCCFFCGCDSEYLVDFEILECDFSLSESKDTITNSLDEVTGKGNISMYGSFYNVVRHILITLACYW